MSQVGRQIRYARRAREWSQERLAREAAVARGSLARLEAGHDTTLRTVEALAATLGLELRLVGPE